MTTAVQTNTAEELQEDKRKKAEVAAGSRGREETAGGFVEAAFVDAHIPQHHVQLEDLGQDHALAQPQKDHFRGLRDALPRLRRDRGEHRRRLRHDGRVHLSLLHERTPR